MEKGFKAIQGLIDRAFTRLWPTDGEKFSTVGGKTLSPPITSSHGVYESIDDYTTQTGKRFRMTKEQKSRGLSRNEAFKEFIS